MKSFQIKRLILPSAVLLLFIILYWMIPGSLVVEEATSGLKEVLSKAFQIGVGVALAWFCVRIIDVFLWRGVEIKLSTPIPRLLKDIVAVIVFIITGITIAKVVFNQPVTAAWATSGVIVFILGLALQNTIADLFCGIAMNVDQPFKINDWIEVHPRTGTFKGCVQEISWRSTRLRTTSNTMVVIPNNMLSTMVIINLSRPEPTSRFSIVICLDFGVPTERALRVLLAGVKAAKGILEQPAPKVLVDKAVDVGVQYKIRYWVDPLETSPRKGRHAVASSVLDHLFQAGITPAYEKQDLFLTRMPNRQLDRMTDRETLLQRVEIFSSLTDEEYKMLAEKMTERQYDPGKTIVKQGDEGDTMYILVEGLLGVYLEKDDDEEAVKLAQLVPGSFFGEMSLLTGEKRSATILTVTSTVVFQISRDDLTPLLEARPEVALQISRIVAKRKREQQEKSRSFVRPSVDEAPARQLVEKMKNFFRGLRGRV